MMQEGVKRLAILGSTGSIGRQTLEIVRAHPDRLRVVGLAAGSNAQLLARQVAEFHPTLVSAQSPTDESFRLLVAAGARLCSPEEMASHPEVDLVVVATAGKAGLGPTLAALGARKQVALANKEVLVMAGAVVTGEADRQGLEIIPIDSEHSALWQCLRGEEGGAVERLILTASGGPFRHASREELSRVTPEQALDHPTWQMGRKVTIDSATLMNKGMEIIEAHWLFRVPYPRIEVVIHPQSVIHSLVEFADGSLKAQLSEPDMRLPIQYALSYPERWPEMLWPRLDLGRRGSLTFEPIAPDRFPCLRLAREAGMRGGTYPAVLSAADEVAVGLFLERRIGFLDIPALVEGALERHRGVEHPSLKDILAADAWARQEAQALAARLSVRPR